MMKMYEVLQVFFGVFFSGCQAHSYVPDSLQSSTTLREVGSSSSALLPSLLKLLSEVQQLSSDHAPFNLSKLL